MCLNVDATSDFSCELFVRTSLFSRNNDIFKRKSHFSHVVLWELRTRHYTQWNFMQPWRRTKCYHLLENGWNWRTSFWVWLAWLKKPKIVCSPSYVDIRSRANTTRGLDYEHMIKAGAHKEGVRIGKTPKKLASICCP
jgi:hypothetical protein